MLDFISSWCGIVGLLVSLLGVFLTWWTLKLAGSIKKAVSEQQGKYVFMIRLPEHIKVLRNAWKSFQTLRKADGSESIDLADLQKNVESVHSVLMHARKSIKRPGNEIFVAGLEFLSPLIQHSEELLDAIRNQSASSSDRFGRYRFTLGMLISELENFKKDQEAKL